MNIFRKRLGKITASYLLVCLLAQLGSPLRAFALTGGPAQSSTQGSPVGSTEMVDLFSGDFKYNIPLFELPGPDGGYPFSLNYNSGIGMDQEASWVGLGWSLSPGAINRGMNGFPDEFKDEAVTVEQDIKPNTTFGVSVSGDIEALGFELGNAVGKTGLGLSIYYNNYRGYGYSVSPSVGLELPYGDSDDKALQDTVGIGVALKLDSQGGIGIEPGVSLKSKTQTFGHDKDGVTTMTTKDANFSAGVSYHSSQGLSGISLGYSMQQKIEHAELAKADKMSRGYAGGVISLVNTSYTPSIGMTMFSQAYDVSIKPGISLFTIFGNAKVGGFYNRQTIRNESKDRKLKAFGYNNFHLAGDKEDSYDFNRESNAALTRSTENLPIPSVTNDDFSVTGAGVGGVFRAFRNDVGYLHDPHRKSKGVTVNVGLEFGAGTKFAIGLGGGYNQTTSREWNLNLNEMKDYYYGEGSSSADYEHYFLKMKGEHSSFSPDLLDYIGGEEAVRLEMGVDGESGRDYDLSTFKLNNKLVKGSRLFSKKVGLLSQRTALSEKRKRATDIRSPKVSQVIKNGQSILPEYDIPNAYREKGHHPVGYTVTPTSGMRYVYGLPSYNLEKKECVYSTQHTFRDMEGIGYKDYDDSYSIKAPIADNKDVEGNNASDGIPDYKEQYPQASNEYFKRTTIPPYAHSYLITSVLGTDYVDIKEDGPTEDDLGYWVKFDYNKTNTESIPYQWRAPFYGSMFNEGADREGYGDNTASYTYGKKEMFYVEKVSTKTHVAYFYKSQRKDARGVSSEFQTKSSNLGAYSYKLDSIQLYTRAEALKLDQQNEVAIPLKSVHFEYTYDLCPNVQNNDKSSEMVSYKDEYGQPRASVDINQHNGKLTLKKVYFTYKGNRRGVLSPYEFDYHELDNTNQINDVENPNYTEFMTDKWGMYSYKNNLQSFFNSGDGSEKDREAYNNQLMNYKYPYTHQPSPKMNYPVAYEATDYDQGGIIYDPDYGSLEDQREEQDINRSVWNLKEIGLPSGATIKVDYEADDYADVHDQQAMQMFKILAFEDNYGNKSAKISHGDKIVVGNGGAQQTNANRIYFRLTEPFKAPVNENAITPEEQKAYDWHENNYFGNLNDLYFNVDMYLKNKYRDGVTFNGGVSRVNKPNISMPITGWADVLGYGFEKENSGDADYTIGWVEVDKKRKKTRSARKYHPFSFASWQYMSYYMNRFVNNPGTGSVTDGGGIDEAAARVKSLISAFKTLGQTFSGGYYARAKRQNWSTEVNLDRSFIRLNNPTKRKIGGGCRVKQIALYDNWGDQTDGEEESSVYGQVYDYTTTETGPDGEERIISSGVASYEPLAGGDENPLRRVKSHENKNVMMHNQVVNFLYPYNEHMYPAPRVGYSKVTTKSLATHYENVQDANNGGEDDFNIPEGIMTSGAVEYEFYTTKDFPVISEETDLERYTFNFSSPLGKIAVGRYFGSQGYQVTLNDMNGRPKKVTYLEQMPNGKLKRENAPYVHYKYKQEPKTYNDGFGSRTVNVLNNRVSVLGNKLNTNGDKVEVIEDQLMGVDWDVALDTRQNVTWSGNIFVSGDADIIFWPFPPALIPLPSAFPSLKYSESKVKTAVLNKVFYRHGILEEVETYDGQALISSKDKVYDGVTGRPVLTTVTNQYDEEIFNYSPPVYKDYAGAGASYNSLGYKFTADAEKIREEYLDANGNITNSSTDKREVLVKVYASTLLTIGDQNLYNALPTRLTKGDEFVVDDENGNLHKLTFLRSLGNDEYLFTGTYDNSKTDKFLHNTTNEKLGFLLTRPGKRNQLGGADQTIVANRNPMENYKTPPEACVQSVIEVNEVNQQIWAKDYKYVEAAALEYFNSLNTTGTYQIPMNSLVYEEPLGGAIYQNTGIRSSFYPQGQFAFRIYEGTTARTVHFTNPNQLTAGFREAVEENRILSYDNITINPFTERFNMDFHFVENGIESVQNLRIHYHNISKFEDILIGNNKSLPPIDLTKTDSILGISAVALSDANFYANFVRALNPFRSGESGIWRASESYVFHKNRNQVFDSKGEVDVKRSGYMNDVTLFDANNYFLSSCDPSWKKVSEVTKYNADGYQVETRDILGLYSAALYNSETEQMMATAVNAKEDEILFEDFEDQTITGGNFDFREAAPSSNGSYYDCEAYQVISGEGTQAITDIPYDKNWGDANGLGEVKLSGAEYSNYSDKKISGTFECSMLPLYDGVNIVANKSILKFDQDPHFVFTFDWAGHVTVCENETYYQDGGSNFYSSPNQNAEIATDFAHTGKKSLKVKTSQSYVTRELKQLDLIPGKEYNLQAWTSFGEGSSVYGSLAGRNALTAGTSVNAPKIEIGYVNTSNQIVWLSPMTPSGAMVEDWQRVGGSFTVPADVNNGHLFVRFHCGENANTSAKLDTYFDDFRICPHNGEMFSYVYNKEFYRLMANLDDRNFATFYHYDDQGSTYLTRVETERGIRTITDARSHAPEKR